MNHFGHSISYHIAEELETDLATTASDKDDATPHGLLQQSGLATGVAWDNYDENSETLSGADTLHDTVGICFQNTTPQHGANTVAESQPEVCTATRKKRKRSFEKEDVQLEPYRKTPKISTFQYETRTCGQPVNLMQMKNRDKLWMMSHAFYDDTPMWIGWNSRVTVDNLPQQSIGYMDNLSLPPTRLDVVAETMRISQKLAAECGEPYALVHYDLGVAKPALQIQAADSPTYDNVFVCLGAFHITMAYFAALGFFLADSGSPQILADTGVLASGSLNGFISGRHYNRCKRIHVLLALAIQMLHFKCFFAEHCPLPESFVKQLKKLQDDPSPDALNAFENSPEYVQVMQMYEEFAEKT
jgi:hypothetical protein